MVPMPKNTQSTQQSMRLQMKPGALLADSLTALGEGLTLPCGGRGSCGKCRAVVQGALQPPTALELQHLSSEDLAAGVRLTCQARSTGGEVVVHAIPKASDFNILVDGFSDAPPSDANLQTTKAILPPASPASLSEWNRLLVAGATVAPAEPPMLNVLRMIPDLWLTARMKWNSSASQIG